MAQRRNRSGISLSGSLTAVPLLLLFSGCTGIVGTETEEGSDSAELSVPTSVKVNGKVVDVETNYLPRVVQCENPGAPFEAMKAQAVAARTYLSYRAGGRVLPSITDGEADQVYTCPANRYGKFVSDDAANAVADTVGQVVKVGGELSAGFFVAGSSRAALTCKELSDPTRTERYVTYNFGRTSVETEHSSIGSSRNEDNHGCFGQRMANCLAAATPMEYTALLRYFYGSDAQVAKMSAATPTAAAIAQQAALDLTQATCFSGSFGRPVPLHACVESATTGLQYQCMEDGSFASTTGTGLSLSGPAGPCSERFEL